MIHPHLELERELWNRGYVHVAGVDEAGKGPLAGPVTAGAVIIHADSQVVPAVRDSKLMTSPQREAVFFSICQLSSAYGVGIVSPQEIDCVGIDEAVRLAMFQALHAAVRMLKSDISYVIVDGSRTLPLTGFETRRIKAGGLYHYSISAASILAKVTRDRLMLQYAREYPQYGFEKHVGYGTKAHLEALRRFGPCALHRRTFRPLSLGIATSTPQKNSHTV